MALPILVIFVVAPDVTELKLYGAPQNLDQRESFELV
jgi:hypothetical protein